MFSAAWILQHGTSRKVSRGVGVKGVDTSIIHIRTWSTRETHQIGSHPSAKAIPFQEIHQFMSKRNVASSAPHPSLMCTPCPYTGPCKTLPCAFKGLSRIFAMHTQQQQSASGLRDSNSLLSHYTQECSSLIVRFSLLTVPSNVLTSKNKLIIMVCISVNSSAAVVIYADAKTLKQLTNWKNEYPLSVILFMTSF